ncbi:hypothetical protein FN846DRAFT_941441 [Sphaerosporella brunnea]|uniref:MARVEL domain-containing protein n=1 Tax=Sphaerosporella brunnea TaxID=1250544 RepID=A0A5J5F1T7_9PEZI|nr:hypothetical protein FN846DRAFT_941441 [Sphaerosporella brunnea]
MVKKCPDHRTAPPGGLMGFILRTSLRVLQIITALIIAGMYGQDLNNDDKAGRKAGPAWVYAEVVVGLSVITAVVYLLPILRSFKFFFFWDAILFIFWTALFGTFGNLYIKRDCNNNGSCNRMKVAVWFDLVGMLLWFISAVVGGCMFWKDRHSRSRGVIV